MKEILFSLKKLKRNYVIICILSLLQGLVFYAPIATIFRTSRGLSVSQIFLAETILLVTMIIFEIPFGYFSDKYGYKKTIIFASILLFLGKVIFFKANFFSTFVVQAIVSGMSIAGFSGVSEAFVYESVEEENLEKAFGIMASIGTSALLIASISSSFLAEKSMELTVFLTLIPYGISIIASLFLEEIEVKDREEKLKFNIIIKDLKKVKTILLFIIATTLISEVTHSIEVFLNQLQYIRSNIDLKYFGIISALGQVVCLSSGIVYKVTKRHGQRNTLFSLFLTIILSIIGLRLTSYWLLSIILILIIQGASSMSVPIIMSIQNKSIDKNRATMLSIYSMVSSILASIINIFIGRFADISLEKSLVFSALLISLSCVVLLIYYRIENKKLN